jgi:hypothetical protein
MRPSAACPGEICCISGGPWPGPGPEPIPF